ncbi:MAG: pseudoazurin [Pseudomonadota bacterium]
MTLTRRQYLALTGAAASAPLLATQAQAQTTHDVQMLNTHPETAGRLMVFYPEIVRAQPGDVVRFLSIDNNHNSQAFDEMLPMGVEPWKSTIGKDFDLTVEAEGAYGFFCTPHKGLGMVGLLLVGDVSGNYEALKEVRQRGKSRQRFKDLFAMADEMLAAEGEA